VKPESDHVVVRFPATTTIGRLKALAADLGCVVYLHEDGTYEFVEKRQPRDYREVVS
jgi:hypothetical protein